MKCSTRERTMPMPVNSTPRNTLLSALLHHKPAALFVIEIEFPHGGSFGRLTAWGLHVPEDLSALADERRAPGAGSCGAGVTVG